MKLKTWSARVRLQNRQVETVTVEAENQTNAKVKLESMYGRGSVIAGPYLVTK